LVKGDFGLPDRPLTWCGLTYGNNYLFAFILSSSFLWPAEAALKLRTAPTLG
jgi:hypothetical protein